MDEWEFWTETPSYYLEAGDPVIWNGEPIILDDAVDLGERIQIFWTDDLDIQHDDEVSTEVTVELWRYV